MKSNNNKLLVLFCKYLLISILAVAPQSMYIFVFAKASSVNIEDVESISLNLDQYIDLVNLEYDDSPYAGRTNLEQIFIPYLQIQGKPFQLNIGSWLRHIYVQFDEDRAPERAYPFLNVIFYPWKQTELIFGNYIDIASLPNTIYNEFLFYERPVSSGLKFSLKRKKINFNSYIDWIELDTKEHPEEFITGFIWEHDFFQNFYYRFYNHYHHRGGQLNKDTHPVRIEQDIVTSPLLGIAYNGIYLEAEYYLSTFSQNFKTSTHGHAGSGTLGCINNNFNISYQCFYNYDYYHGDAHIFYNKRKNILNRFRIDYNIFQYKEIVDMLFTVNLYGVDPPGIDFRVFAKINLSIIKYKTDESEKKELK